MWLQWSFQPWHHLWINHSRVIGPYVQLEPYATTWTGPQTLGRIRSWFLSPSRKEALSLHQVKAHDVRAFAASKAFQSGISLDKILSACHWKSHNTFTQFYLKDVAWADSELFHLGPVVAAQQVHHQTQK